MKRRLDPALATALARPTDDRSPKKAILIALEDEESSRLYFESFQQELELSRVQVAIAPHGGSHPKNVINAAKIAEAERDAQAKSGLDDPFDEIWVVFDTEGQQSQRYIDARNAVEQARVLGYKTATSNPTFEFWLLLHFVYHVQTIRDGAAANSLLRKHIKRYDKGSNAYEATRTLLEIARKHARRIFTERGKEGEATHPCDLHPCTEIYRLIDSLLE